MSILKADLFFEKVACCMALICSVSCSDTSTRSQVDVGYGADSSSDDVPVNDVSRDSSTSGNECVSDDSGDVYTVLYVETQSDVFIDTISVRPCNSNSELFPFKVEDAITSTSAESILGLPDSTCDDGFVFLTPNDEFIEVVFYQTNIKRGDEVEIYLKRCEGDQGLVEDINLDVVTFDGQRVDLRFELTSDNTFIVQ